jgi:hypothetical protein
MRSREEQIAGLRRLADEISPAEVNFVINLTPRGDVPNLEMLDTSGSPQMVYADQSTDTYDFWSSGKLVKPNIPLEEAARIMIQEYFVAKAKRIQKHHPHLSKTWIMKRLWEGYQRKGPDSSN